MNDTEHKCLAVKCRKLLRKSATHKECFGVDTYWCNIYKKGTEIIEAVIFVLLLVLVSSEMYILCINKIIVVTESVT